MACSTSVWFLSRHGYSALAQRMLCCYDRGEGGARNGSTAAASASGRGKSKLEQLMEQDKAKKAALQARQAQPTAQPAANGSR